MPNHAETPAQDVEYRRRWFALSEQRLVTDEHVHRTGTEQSLQAVVIEFVHHPFGKFRVMPCPSLRPCT